MARLIGYLALAAAAVCGCGDGGESAPGEQNSTLEDAAAADAAGRAVPAGGRTPEPGLTAIALSQPEVEPTRSRVMRIDPDAAPCEEVDESPDCPDNSAPVIEPILYEVNGLLYDELPEVFADDEVLLLVPFRDDDCNLGCGTSDLRFSFEGPRQSGVGAGGGLPLPMDIPCSTAESQTYLEHRTG